MLQERITAFALSPQNQQFAQELSRTITHQILTTPIADYVGLVSTHQRHQAELLAREVVHSSELDDLARHAIVAVFDDLYGVIRKKRIGELLRLDSHANKIAEQLADAIVPLLHRPAILEFIAVEASRTPA
jgi:hypothetical protein